jgi:hypothetical protein
VASRLGSSSQLLLNCLTLKVKAPLPLSSATTNGQSTQPNIPEKLNLPENCFRSQNVV